MIKHYTQAELKHAYHLVAADLQQQLLAMKPEQVLRVNKLGKFTKKKVRGTCSFPDLKGQPYVCYRINFSPFRSLKDALNQELENELR